MNSFTGWTEGGGVVVRNHKRRHLDRRRKFLPEANGMETNNRTNGNRIEAPPQSPGLYRGTQMSATTTPMTVNELVSASAEWDAEFSEIPLNPDDLHF